MNVATGVRLLVAVVCLTVMASPAWARGRAGSGLAGSPHDFTNPQNSLHVHQGVGNADRCIFCHVGHPDSTTIGRPQENHRLTPSTSTRNASNTRSGPQAPDAFDYQPLWKHELTGTYAAYTMYQSGPGAPQVGAKAAQAIANGMTPGSTSLLCLSCHDGSVAVNIVGKDNYLGNHHPVGFDYEAVRSVDKEIRPADTARLGTAGSVRDHLYGESNTRMECGTCHSVHNTGNTGEALLWRSDACSRLCLTCHDKGTDPVAMIP